MWLKYLDLARVQETTFRTSYGYCIMLLIVLHAVGYGIFVCLQWGGREVEGEREREGEGEREGERDFMFDRARLPHLVGYATFTRLCSIDPHP